MVNINIEILPAASVAAVANAMSLVLETVPEQSSYWAYQVDGVRHKLMGESPYASDVGLL